jgi:hypothetical protein
LIFADEDAGDLRRARHFRRTLTQEARGESRKGPWIIYKAVAVLIVVGYEALAIMQS